MKAAVVTGAASGIGRATAERMALAGTRVLAVDIDKDRMGWVADTEGIESLCADVCIEADNERMVETALSRFGRLDAAILNAGRPGSGPIDQLDLAVFENVLAVNLRGVALGIRAAVPAMRRGCGGAIVVTASVSGLGGDPGMWAYNAAKGGVVNLVRAAAVDHAHEGIRINAVCPGATLTHMTRPMLERDSGVYDHLRRRIPMQRWAEAREIAAAIVFLASTDASFITGAVLPVDGGVTASSGQFDPPSGNSS